MSEYAKEISLNFPKFMIGRLCDDSIVGDTCVEDGLNFISRGCFLTFLHTWEHTGEVDQEILDAAATAHCYANIYVVLHITNRMQKKSAVHFCLIHDFKTLHGLMEEDLKIANPSKRLLNKVLIGQHLSAIMEKVDDMMNVSESNTST